MSGFIDWLKGITGSGAEDENSKEFGFTPKPGTSQKPVSFRTGNEMGGYAAGLQGAAALIDGFQKEEADRQDYNREIAFRNAQMQQAYQNNLPNMYDVRRRARISANALASLGGI